MDFYLIPDFSTLLADPGSKEHVHLGSLTLQEHRILRRVWECCKPHNIEVPFFDDIRLSYEEVQKLHDCCQQCYAIAKKETGVDVPPIYRKLINLLEPAIKEGMGIFTICD